MCAGHLHLDLRFRGTPKCNHVHLSVLSSDTDWCRLPGDSFFSSRIPEPGCLFITKLWYSIPSSYQGRGNKRILTAQLLLFYFLSHWIFSFLFVGPVAGLDDLGRWVETLTFLSAGNRFWRCTFRVLGLGLFHVPTGQEEYETVPYGRENIMTSHPPWCLHTAAAQSVAQRNKKDGGQLPATRSENPVIIALLHCKFSNHWRGLPLFLLFMFSSLYSSTFVDAFFWKVVGWRRLKSLLLIWNAPLEYYAWIIVVWARGS
jgi:hypothetical protein